MSTKHNVFRRLSVFRQDFFLFRHVCVCSSINTPLSFCVKRMSTERLSESPLNHCLYMFVFVLIPNQ
ncbi:hypothetical protein HanIR_Chr01g0032171 [Helianthus annuus]|nr:hypothetical protein HanIR_Chr01g0032171 [Helianthus annuus]